ncbi:O-antigen ligase family protein [Streptomyces sp. TRM76323]|uniref:O-antigen ligase family protein n=1 Tax=Streptomyces tamarix TaxID=3078565 RepID=A0ABU3QQI9_9ACTN|nr:O-antigen ligase family protein [Streptomyces tamarix]MDT9684866.1 O-antigen ligase family protein [Streptomyces tamarix]
MATPAAPAPYGFRLPAAVRVPSARPAALARWARLVPLLAVVALLAVPPGSAPASGGGTVADAASGVLVLWCLVRVARARVRPLTRVAAVVLGLPVVGICVAAVTAHDPAAALPGLVRHLQVFVLVPAAVVLTLRDRRDLVAVAWALIGLALVQGGVGVVQYATGTGASYRGEDVRAVGTFGPADVMGMATVVAYGIVAAVGLALGAPARSRARAAALACAALLTVPLVLSFSRGAWIATVLACAAQLAATGVRRALRAALAAGALAVVLVGGLGVGSAMVQERAASITRVAAAPDRSVTDRYALWAAAAGMWRDRPLTGVGLKGFPAHRDSHASLALSSGSDTGGAGTAFRRQPLLSPHNMYLLVLGEQGLLGLLTLAGGWLVLLVRGCRRLPAARRTGRRLDCALVALGLLGWQLVDFLYADIGGPSTVVTAVVLGVAAWWGLSGGSSGHLSASSSGPSGHLSASPSGPSDHPSGDPSAAPSGGAPGGRP